MPLNSLVLDAGPLITQSYSSLQSRAEHFYTTPSVYNEIKDKRARQNLLRWGPSLQVRQPQLKYVQIVSDFAKKTGDYSVLSSTDIHIIALCYELECELNNGDWRLRKNQGRGSINKILEQVSRGEKQVFGSNNEMKSSVNVKNENDEQPELEQSQKKEEDEGWEVVATKPKRGKNKKSTKSNKNSTPPFAVEPSIETKGEVEEPTEESEKPASVSEAQAEIPQTNESHHELAEDSDSDSEAGWITSSNLLFTLEKDGGDLHVSTDDKTVKAAMATGDFAMQNVALQIGLNVVNASNGLVIKQIKNYMLRCHACFKLTLYPKDGKMLQFCPRCGGNTLLRCTVSVSSSGHVRVHLRKNMQWSHRGDKYSLPSPQSRNARRQRHDPNPILLREDQKEYQKAIKDDLWKKRHNEKVLEEWVGTGSADSINSPFAISGYKRDATRHTGVKVGRGRYVNSKARSSK